MSPSDAADLGRCRRGVEPLRIVVMPQHDRQITAPSVEPMPWLSEGCGRCLCRPTTLTGYLTKVVRVAAPHPTCSQIPSLPTVESWLPTAISMVKFAVPRTIGFSATPSARSRVHPVYADQPDHFDHARGRGSQDGLECRRALA
jgi:hypothetical protein